MRSIVATVITMIALVAAAQADGGRSCEATCDGHGHCTPGCSSSGTSSQAPDPQVAAALAAEREKRAQIDADNAARQSVKARIHATRDYTKRGIDAYRHKQWSRAIDYFEAALRRDPNNVVIERDLAQVRAAQAAEEKAREDKQRAPTAPIDVTAKTVQIASLPVAPRRRVIFVPAPAPGGDWHSTPATPAIEIDQSQLSSARKLLHEAAADLDDFAKHAALHVPAQIAGVANVVEFVDQIKDAKELSEKYNETTERLVEEAAGAAHETASILVFGEGSTEHVLDATKRMEETLGQFVDERVRSALWDATKTWGGDAIVRLIQGER